MKKMIVFVFIIGILITFTTPTHAVVLFSDNFDNHSDWSPSQPAYGSALSSQNGSAAVACSGCPDGPAKYAGYRVARTGFSGGRIGKNTINITSDNARGGTGKAFTFYVEPIVASLAEDWTNDGLLAIKLNGNYDTIYIRYYIKFSPNWVFDDNDSSALKMGHMQHTVSGGSMWQYFKAGDNWPIAVPVFAKENEGTYEYWGGDAIFRMAIRKQSCYYPSDGYNNMPDDVANDFFRYGISKTSTNGTLGSSSSLTWKESLMDGNWHCVEYKLKGNSAKGVSDGEWLMYIDDHLAISKTNIPWADMGADASGNTKCSDCSGRVISPPSNFVGWNTVIIGGNAYIQRYPNTSSTDVEQWYSIDDLVISTTRVGTDSGGSPPGTPPFSRKTIE